MLSVNGEKKKIHFGRRRSPKSCERRKGTKWDSEGSGLFYGITSLTKWWNERQRKLDTLDNLVKIRS